MFKKVFLVVTVLLIAPMSFAVDRNDLNVEFLTDSMMITYTNMPNPIRFFMVLTRGIFLKGMGVEDVMINLIPLIIIASITLTLASRTFKRKLG